MDGARCYGVWGDGSREWRGDGRLGGVAKGDGAGIEVGWGEGRQVGGRYGELGA